MERVECRHGEGAESARRSTSAPAPETEQSSSTGGRQRSRRAPKAPRSAFTSAAAGTAEIGSGGGSLDRVVPVQRSSGIWTCLSAKISAD
jgi:hypothetical protein